MTERYVLDDDADDEAALVAALLDCLQYHATDVPALFAELPAGAFTGATTGPIVEAIAAAVRSGSIPTTGEVAARLRDAGHGIGSPVYLTLVEAAHDYVNTGPRALDTARLAVERIGRRHRQRLATAAAERFATSPDAVTRAELAEALEGLDAAAAGPRRTSTLTDYLDQWRRRERPPRVPTGFGWFDEPTAGGLPIGGIVSLFAPPKSAKSAFALQLVVGAMLQNPDLRVVWGRGEMNAEDFANRCIALGSGLVEGCEAVMKQEAENRHPKARRAAVKIAAAFGDRITFVDPKLTVPKIAAAVQETGAGVVVIDYIQKVVLPDGGRDPVRDADTIVGDVRDLTERANVATIMVSSMSKPTSGTGGNLGQLGRGTVEIGHVCELGYEAVVRNRDAEGNPVVDDDGCFDIRWRCAGARNLPQRDLVLRFHGATQTYFDATPWNDTFAATAAPAGPVPLTAWTPPGAAP
jgi:replicative DNA helicase